MQSSDSQAIVQITAPLKAVEEWLNRDLPEVLHSDGPRKIVIPAKRKSIKVPKMKKFKVRMETKHIDISPKISGDVTENVSRQGPLRLSGKGGTIVATQVIYAHVTARGRGAIGEHIRQSADGAALVTASLSANIAPDWTLQGHLDLSHCWQKRPTANLFGKIPITVGTKADKAIAKAKEGFLSRLPSILQNISLRRKMEDFWAEIQEPIALSIDNAESKLYLHILPKAVSMSKLDFSGDIAKVAFGVKAQTVVTPDRNTPWKRPSRLPNLTTLEPNTRGFELALPLIIDGNTLSALSATQLPIVIPAERFGLKQVQIVGLDFGFVDAKVLVAAQIKAEYSNRATPIEKTMKFLAVPEFSSSTQTVTLVDLIVRSNSLLESMTNLLQSKGVISDEFSVEGGLSIKKAIEQSTGILSEHFSFSIKKAIEQAEMQVAQSLKDAKFNGVKTTGNFAINILDMVITKKSMKINTKMVGRLGIDLSL